MTGAASHRRANNMARARGGRMPIVFGTEGWRAIMAEGFTVERVRVVAQAVAEHFRSLRRPAGSTRTMAVGYDTRFLSDRFAAEVSDVLAANGIRFLRAYGLSIHPNILGGTLAVGSLFALGGFTEAGGVRRVGWGLIFLLRQARYGSLHVLL